MVPQLPAQVIENMKPGELRTNSIILNSYQNSTCPFSNYDNLLG